MANTVEYPVPKNFFTGPVDRTRPQLPPIADPDYDWQREGLCGQTDPEAFFPEKGGSMNQARRMCLSCDVARQCLKYALDYEDQIGMMGGLSPAERKKVIKNPDDIVAITDKAWGIKTEKSVEAQEAA